MGQTGAWVRRCGVEKTGAIGLVRLEQRAAQSGQNVAPEPMAGTAESMSAGSSAGQPPQSIGEPEHWRSAAAELPERQPELLSWESQGSWRKALSLERRWGLERGVPLQSLQ
jgi:hypothetical protein